MITAAAPEGTPPRRVNDCKLLKTILPAVPRRGPEAGDHHKILISDIWKDSLQKTLFGIQQVMSLRIKNFYPIQKGHNSNKIRVIPVFSTAAVV